MRSTYRPYTPPSLSEDRRPIEPHDLVVFLRELEWPVGANIALWGSYARNEAGERSDIDLWCDGGSIHGHAALEAAINATRMAGFGHIDVTLSRNERDLAAPICWSVANDGIPIVGQLPDSSGIGSRSSAITLWRSAYAQRILPSTRRGYRPSSMAWRAWSARIALLAVCDPELWRAVRQSGENQLAGLFAISGYARAGAPDLRWWRDRRLMDHLEMAVHAH